MAKTDRVYSNFPTGVLGSKLIVGQTTLTFAEDPGLPTVADPEYMALVLDPFGSQEIVHVTAYTTGALTAIIERGQEGTAQAEHDAGTEWYLSATADTYNSLVTRFTDLLDADPDMTGHAGEAVIVTGTEDGLEYGPAGAALFTDLTDTPADYTGHAGKSVVVTAGEDGLEFVVVEGGGSVAAAQEHYTAANITINSTSWADLPGPSDLVIPAAAGDVVVVGATLTGGAEAVDAHFDIVSIVAGSPVNSWANDAAALTGTTGTAMRALRCIASTNSHKGATAMRAVVAGDISGGNVTLRVRYRTETATNKTVFANMEGPFHYWAVNLGSAGGGGGGVTVVSQTRTAGNIALGGSTTWAAISTGLDLVIPAVAGDIIEVQMSAVWDNAAVTTGVEAFTMDGVPAAVNPLTAGGASDFGTPAWLLASTSVGRTTVPSSAGGTVYTVQAGDIVSGNVTLRPFYRQTSAAAITLRANANQPFRWWVKNLGQ